MASSRSRWIGLLFISLAISLVIIDGTIVNTIFPEIISGLGLTSTEVQWVQESYVLDLCRDTSHLGLVSRPLWPPAGIAHWNRDFCGGIGLGGVGR